MTRIKNYDENVFTSVIDTLAGGVILDLDGYTASKVPAGTLVGKDFATGFGAIINNIENPPPNIEPIGLVADTAKNDGNVIVDVVTVGSARVSQLPHYERENYKKIQDELKTIRFF